MEMSLVPPFANELVSHILSFADLDSLIKLTQVRNYNKNCKAVDPLTLGLGLERRTNLDILDVDHIPSMATRVPGCA